MGVLKKVLLLAVLATAVAVLWQWMTSVDVDLEEFYRGKRVVLTGASRGIGKVLALRLAQLGARLVIGARSVDKLTETQEQCHAHTPDVYTVVGDVLEEDVCRRLVETAVEQFGGVDIVIINAAMTPSPPEEFMKIKNPADTLSRYFGVNVLQAVYLTQFAMPYLNASSGIIVPVSSLAGNIAIPQTSMYTTTKHALQGVFKSINQELVMSNSSVSITIMPLPYVLTEQSLKGWKPVDGQGMSVEDCVERMVRGIPLRQLWYFIDWPGYILLHLYSLAPAFFDHYTLKFLPIVIKNFPKV